MTDVVATDDTDVSANIAADIPHVEHRGRARYYFYVMSCLQLLQPLLYDTPPTERANEYRSESEDGDDNSEVVSTWHALCEAMQGAPASLCHCGPLSARQLHALSAVSDDAMRALLHELARRRGMDQTASNALQSSHEMGMSLFPVMSELRERLWPTETHDGATSIQARYCEAVAEAQKGRARCSEQMLKEGYLHEAGLTALRVLAGVDGANAESSATPASTSVLREWAALIDAYTLFLPDRSCVHELENLPQEIAIGELVADCVRRVRVTESGFALRAVVDVGGGNGFLAAQLAERLDCDGLVVDPYYPSHAIDCGPRRWPDTQHRVRPAHARRRTLQRHMAFFKDTLWARDIGCSPAHTALVAKHLCGSAVDECLGHLRAQHCLPRILILAPCCFHKGSYAAYINQPYLHSVLHVHDEPSYAKLAAMTNWSRSTYQSTMVARSRHTARGQLNDYIACTEAMAEGVQCLLTYGRLLWLREQGYAVRFVEYVPAYVTPKNRCIVAVRM